jgi:hypothetical protein
VETAGVEPTSSSLQARRSSWLSYVPKERCGWMESNHHSARRQGYSLLSSPRARHPHEGGRPGSNRRLRGSPPRVLPLTPRPPCNGDDRNRTGGFSPDKRALEPLSYAPWMKLVDSAGGIRTHGLELMRLARTASPLPRSLAGRSRTCDLRRPKPAGWPTPPQPVVVHSTPGGARTRSFRVEGPASSPVRPRGHEGHELRRQGSNLPLASNSRASCRLDHAGMNGRRGSRTPKGRTARPFSRRDTAPMAVLPNKSGFGKSRTCTSPGKSREL